MLDATSFFASATLRAMSEIFIDSPAGGSEDAVVAAAAEAGDGTAVERDGAAAAVAGNVGLIGGAAAPPPLRMALKEAILAAISALLCAMRASFVS
jgi:hypothetical protein